MTEPHIRLARLFAGRTDAWGLVHGEACKLDLTSDDWRDHAYGDGSVGVYPLVPRQFADDGVRVTWSVKWGCVDIDEGYGAGLVIARNLHKTYEVLGLTAWIERTKGKGYHVWLLCDGWVPAVEMRAVQILACTLIEYTPKEINPKQTALQDGALGNYVNIPYAKQWTDVGKRVVLDQLGEGWDYTIAYTLQEFLDRAEASLNDAAQIAEVAALYKPPPPPAPVTFEDTPGFEGPEDPRMGPLPRKMFIEGPLPSLETGRIDRSRALAKLAHILAADGFTAGETLGLVRYYDTHNAMQKYVGRRDAEDQYRKIVERAYQ